MFDVYIGYDVREDRASRVCVASLLRRSSVPLRIHALEQSYLRAAGYYWRPWRTEAETYPQKYDMLDGRPFSTDFAFSRFLVPYIHRERVGAGPALFVDCDFLFRADVAQLFALFDRTKTVQVVKHEYAPTEETKMDGVQQSTYRRKNWSSLMLFNCDRARLPLSYVNGASGRHLHGFEWCADDSIGALPEAWNWLEGHSSPDIDPAAVHFTRGGPWFEDYTLVDYAEEWLTEERKTQGPPVYTS